MDISKLRSLAVSLKVAKSNVENIEDAWGEEASKCEYFHMGIDDFGCLHPDEFIDPVCTAENCPLIKED